MENWINKENISSKIKEKIVNENVLIAVEMMVKDEMSISIYNNCFDSEPIYTINAKSPEKSKEFIRTILPELNFKNGQLMVDSSHASKEKKFETHMINGEEIVFEVGEKQPSSGSYTTNEIENVYGNKYVIEANYNNGQKEGIRKVYYEKGQLTVEEKCNNGKWECIRRDYSGDYGDGQIRVEENYKNGKREGIRKEYYENGQWEGIILKK